MTVKRSEEAALVRREALGTLQPLRPAGSYTFEELYRLGQVLYKSGLFEDVKDEAQAVVKILRGQEMGIPPTTAMSAFDLIQKKLFIKPWAIAAKINACGYGSYRVLAQTAEACTIRFARKYPGEGWQPCPDVTYTFAEALAHGLTTRSGHWKASPANMLYMRAMGRGGAMYFPELLAGLTPPQEDTPVTEEEGATNVIDLFGDTAAVATAQATARTVTLVARTTEPTHPRLTPLGLKIKALLTAQGLTAVQQDQQWEAWQAHYRDFSPGVLTLIHDQLTPPQALARDSTPTGAWRTMLSDVLGDVRDADLMREATGVLEDAEAPTADGEAILARVLNALEAQDAATGTAHPF